MSSPTHAAGFSRSHACTHRKAAEKVILSSCGGLNKHYRESEKARKRDLGLLLPLARALPWLLLPPLELRLGLLCLWRLDWAPDEPLAGE